MADDFDIENLEPVPRSSPEELFLLTLEGKPTADSDDFGEAAGAFISCWIDRDDLQAAAGKALDMILADGWVPTRMDGWEMVTRQTYVERNPEDADPEDGDLDYLELVEEAFKEGGAIVFHAWKAGDPG